MSDTFRVFVQPTDAPSQKDLTAEGKENAQKPQQPVIAGTAVSDYIQIMTDAGIIAANLQSESGTYPPQR